MMIIVWLDDWYGIDVKNIILRYLFLNIFGKHDDVATSMKPKCFLLVFIYLII
jgi:hypothetical protein